jgi:hypothetical protein
VAGASVSLDQSKTGASTDAQGRFTLATPVSLLPRSRGFHARAGTPRSGNSNMQVSLGGGTYSVAGRSLEAAPGPAETRIAADDRNPVGPGMPDPDDGMISPALAKPAAAWKDTLAVSKAAYLAQRIVPATGDGDVGDIVLRAVFPGSPTRFFGFDRYNFTVSGKSCLVVVPKKVRAGNPWIWRTYFWAHKPLFDSIYSIPSCAPGAITWPSWMRPISTGFPAPSP